MMNRYEILSVAIVFLFVISLFVFIWYEFPQYKVEEVLINDVQAMAFSPDGGCRALIIEWIDRANASIKILSYSFTSYNISYALSNAVVRGVDVMVLFEAGQVTMYSEYQRLKTYGATVKVDGNSHLMNENVMIVDNVAVLCGSYEYTDASEHGNNEFLFLIQSHNVVSKFLLEFNRLWEMGVDTF